MTQDYYPDALAAMIAQSREIDLAITQVHEAPILYEERLWVAMVQGDPCQHVRDWVEYRRVEDVAAECNRLARGKHFAALHRANIRSN